LKALGPNDDLIGAIDELTLLLKEEIPIIVTQINKRTSDTHEIVKGTHEIIKEASIVGTQINERTEETLKTMEKHAIIATDRTAEVQRGIEGIKEGVNIGMRLTRQLSVGMDRIEGYSASSQASLEELTEKFNVLLSNVNGSTFQSFAYGRKEGCR
jgi:methyl-accepting chemotaxis protein